MHPASSDSPAAAVTAALAADDSSVRLRAALEAGTHPDQCPVEVLVERCAVEPDFFVRDMLTWALTRHPTDITVPLLLTETRSARTQARSQALHTLSKIGDPTSWPAVTRELLNDPDDTVARTAWRAGAVLVPDTERAALAADLSTQLGRGDTETQKSLSRALSALGDAAVPHVNTARTHDNPAIRAHAYATSVLLDDPEASFDGVLEEAIRITALDPARRGDTSQ